MKTRFLRIGWYAMTALLGMPTLSHAKGDNECEALARQASADAHAYDEDFENLISQKISHEMFVNHGTHFKKFFAWALNIKESSVDSAAIKAVASMLKLNEAKFNQFFSDLGVSKSEFAQVAQQYADLMTDADFRYAPSHRPGAAVPVDIAKLKQIDEDLFAEWHPKLAKTRDTLATAAAAMAARPRDSGYRLSHPDLSSKFDVMDHLFHLVTRSALAGSRKWHFTTDEPFALIGQNGQASRYTLLLAEAGKVEVNRLRSYAEADNLEAGPEEPGRFMDVLSLDGDERVHLHFEYPGVGQRVPGYDALAGDPILTAVWAKNAAGQWLDVTSETDPKPLKVMYKDNKQIKFGPHRITYLEPTPQP